MSHHHDTPHEAPDPPPPLPRSGVGKGLRWSFSIAGGCWSLFLLRLISAGDIHEGAPLLTLLALTYSAAAIPAGLVVGLTRPRLRPFFGRTLMAWFTLVIMLAGPAVADPRSSPPSDRLVLVAFLIPITVVAALGLAWLAPFMGLDRTWVLGGDWS